MATFKTRLSQISKSNGKVILANDYNSSEKNLQSKTIQNIKKLNLLKSSEFAGISYFE